jgi:hypothetical protein
MPRNGNQQIADEIIRLTGLVESNAKQPARHQEGKRWQEARALEIRTLRVALSVHVTKTSSGYFVEDTEAVEEFIANRLNERVRERNFATCTKCGAEKPKFRMFKDSSGWVCVVENDGRREIRCA